MSRIFLLAHNPGYRAILALIIQHQSQQMLQVVGGASWDVGTLGAIRAARPDAIVAVVGLEVGAELRRLAQLRALAPSCQLLVIDTFGEIRGWQAHGWETADVLLSAEQLPTELVPALYRLVVQGTAPAAA